MIFMSRLYAANIYLFRTSLNKKVASYLSERNASIECLLIRGLLLQNLSEFVLKFLSPEIGGDHFSFGIKKKILGNGLYTINLAY